jgi:hypothetical protein
MGKLRKNRKKSLKPSGILSDNSFDLNPNFLLFLHQLSKKKSRKYVQRTNEKLRDLTTISSLQNRINDNSVDITSQ